MTSDLLECHSSKMLLICIRESLPDTPDLSFLSPMGVPTKSAFLLVTLISSVRAPILIFGITIYSTQNFLEWLIFCFSLKVFPRSNIQWWVLADPIPTMKMDNDFPTWPAPTHFIRWWFPFYLSKRPPFSFVYVSLYACKHVYIHLPTHYQYEIMYFNFFNGL